ncbi:hypothetical protein M671_09860 [Neisseria gonorrhoeae CH811]|nr:hypothetical protein M671_09860 [Neisseria gonorrhoeae CH811]
MCRPLRPPDAGKVGKFPAAERAKRTKTRSRRGAMY